MDRARRTGAPTLSRLTVRKKNRRRPGSVWSRLPKPAVTVDACGRALRRALPALAAAGSVAVVSTSVFLGYRWVTKSHRFAITAIEVRGTERLTADEILATAPAQVGANIFKTSVTDVERAVSAHPWVDAAEVRRELPHTLVIDIREHRAAAVARVDTGESYLVDAAGEPFKRVDPATGEAAGLPVVTGLPRAAFARDPRATAVSITVALAALSTWSAEPSRPAIDEVQLDAAGAVTLHTAEPSAQIQLGHLPYGTAGEAVAVALAPRLHAFDATWAELADAERSRVRTIHLDSRTDQVTVAFPPPPAS